ncbi:MAG TPA: D-aminoacyl-tRNA deacylase [Pirellulaceae bacterium]
MRACVQRVTKASVQVDDEMVAQIASGMLVLLGVAGTDTVADAVYLAEKIAHLRIFGDEAGKMNRSVIDTGGSVLVVSQFTLLADCRKGRRPAFTDAAPPEQAEQLYEAFSEHLVQCGVPVSRGRFRAMMQVALINDGPVTVLLESPPGVG